VAAIGADKALLEAFVASGGFPARDDSRRPRAAQWRDCGEFIATMTSPAFLPDNSPAPHAVMLDLQLTGC
jgi:hypothetical protein